MRRYLRMLDGVGLTNTRKAYRHTVLLPSIYSGVFHNRFRSLQERDADGLDHRVEELVHVSQVQLRMDNNNH